MEQAASKVSDLVLRRIRRDIQGWTQTLKQGSSALGDHSARAANELEYSSRVWIDVQGEIEKLLAGTDKLTLAKLDQALALMPPERAILRYHLERLTEEYSKVCMNSSEQVVEAFKKAEAAIDAGEFESGLNLIDSLLRLDPKYYPALMLKAVTLMRSERGRAESIRLFDRALQQPPEVFTDRYRAITIELLALAHQYDSEPRNAIKTLRRIRSLGISDASVDYNIARNYAKAGQLPEATTALFEAFNQRSLLLSLALVDRDFSSVRRAVMEKLEEESELHGERVVQLIKQGRQILRLATDLQIDKRDRAITRGTSSLEEMDKLLDDGCYSVYRDILIKKMPGWVNTVPKTIEKKINDYNAEKIDEIRKHNESVVQSYLKKRSTFLGVGIPLWGLLSAFVFMLAVSNGSGTTAAMISSALTLLIGIIPLNAVNSHLRKSYAEKQITADQVPDFRKEADSLTGLKNSMVGILRESGVGVRKPA